ncbi:hypothetical protein M3B43_00545 [Nesterenkonia massiliensis]|uniref:DUF559 domain-containing protein n=1 Tax=Nesterenkonia massiliensis TaxID=1232429 RepID=A0ABT2HMC4_9MICC|nr:hypothetical protein [Nesterenkonia massiliensis]MCT1605830.1 hypothetical protein [Nesterenkonia massiliensis]
MKSPEDRRRRAHNYLVPRHGLTRREALEQLPARDIRHALANDSLISLGHGLLGPETDNASPSALHTLQALTAIGGRTVGHETAAALWGLMPVPLGPPYHLIHARGRARTRRSGLVVSHTADVPERFCATYQSIPLTDPAWTWTDLALKLPMLQALILADIAVRPGRTEFGETTGSLTRVSDLRDAAKARGPANGAKTVRTASLLARPGADSPQETTLRYYMYEANLPEPQVNVWLLDEHGRRIVQPDLSVEKYRLAIQYEGQSVHSDPEQVLRDVRRQERTEALGWVEVRITKEHMRHSGAGAIAKITRALRKQGWRS